MRTRYLRRILRRTMSMITLNIDEWLRVELPPAPLILILVADQDLQ